MSFHLNSGKRIHCAPTGITSCQGPAFLGSGTFAPRFVGGRLHLQNVTFFDDYAYGGLAVKSVKAPAC